MRALLGGASNVMITRQGSRIVPIPFDEILDPATGKTRVRMLDTSTETFETARSLQVRLEPADLDDPYTVKSLHETTGLEADALRARYA